MSSLAIIGGTGLYQLGEGRHETISTPFGDSLITHINFIDTEVVFLARHGVDHSLPPHRINYRANIWALHSLGIRDVLATQAVGSLNRKLPPGSWSLLSQFIDLTHGREATFFNGDDGQVVHVDVSMPYCPRLSEFAHRASATVKADIYSTAVYACTQGPRFETSAEVKLLQQFGADVVGMTNVPEVVLAREAGLCYAALCIVSNWGAGMTDNLLSHKEVLDLMNEENTRLRKMITILAHERKPGNCRCSETGFAHLLP